MLRSSWLRELFSSCGGDYAPFAASGLLIAVASLGLGVGSGQQELAVAAPRL